jgi:HPt (histidine-containing phosphotransfer) domain-containing protein
MEEFIYRHIFECIPEIDYNSGCRYFLGNMDNYKQALLATLKSTKSKLPLLQTMLRTKEYEGLRLIVQTLRRMLNSVGAHGFSEESYRLEKTLLNESDFDLDKELHNYMNELIVFVEHLELLLKQLEVKAPGKMEEYHLSFRNYDFTKTRESIKLSNDLLERKII